VYIATLTSILIADYWFVRKRMWKVPDLYVENGIYWYKGGWNLRAIVALAVGMIPGLPGFFIMVIDTSNTSNAGVKIFQIYYFIGFPLGALTYIVLCQFWPPAGLGEREFMREDEDGNGVSVLEGEVVEPIDDKAVAFTEKKTESDSF
jgi:NCS1 family nucleobase:cation symporter-1